MSIPTHEEHVTVDTAYSAYCLEGACEHVDEDGEPEDLSACPKVPPFEVCVDCMDAEGRGRDPQQWDDVPLLEWPHPSDLHPSETHPETRHADD